MFAIKKYFFFFVWSYFRATHRSVLTRAFWWLCLKICLTLICIHKWACKKTFRVKSWFSKYKLFWHFLCFEHKTIWFIFLEKAKWSPFSWRTILYLVFICIICLFMEIRTGNTRESLKKHACWKNYSLSC